MAQCEDQSQERKEPTHSSSEPKATAVPTPSIVITTSGMPSSCSSATFPEGWSSRPGQVAKMDPATPVEIIEIIDDGEVQVKKPPKVDPWWNVK